MWRCQRFSGLCPFLGHSPHSDYSSILEAGEESLHRRRAFTSLSGGVSRFDRQTRYYSLPFQDASAREERSPEKKNKGNQKRDERNERGSRRKIAGRTKRHSQGVAFCFPVLVTGLPANHGRWLSTAPIAGSSGRSSLVGPLLADALAGRLLFCGLAGIFQLPVHHWRLLISNHHAVSFSSCFQ